MSRKGKIFRYIMLLFIIGVYLTVFTGCSRHKRVTKELETVTMGIDVARYQGTIDWQAVSQSGVDFAIVRVGYRGMGDGEITPDPNGRYNMQEASKAGVPLGVYFFSTALSKDVWILTASALVFVIFQNVKLVIGTKQNMSLGGSYCM